MKAKIYNFRKWIKIADERYLKNYFNDLLLKSNFRIINVLEHQFNPYGYTALFLLSESHFAIHTFPEENKTYIELSSCVKEQFELFKKNLIIRS